MHLNKYIYLSLSSAFMQCGTIQPCPCMFRGGLFVFSQYNRKWHISLPLFVWHPHVSLLAPCVHRGASCVVLSWMHSTCDSVCPMVMCHCHLSSDFSMHAMQCSFFFYVGLCACACMHVCMCMRMRVCICVCMSMCVHGYMCLYVCVFVCLCVCACIRACMRACVFRWVCVTVCLFPAHSRVC